MKKLIWILIILVFILYAIVVWGWIEEGNRHFEQTRQERVQGL